MSVRCASAVLGEGQRHRTLVVGEHHTLLQGRRQGQQTETFQQRMKQRNAIEGTQSELVRGHGLRRARSRGLAKARLQNYFIGAACNVKRWIRHEAWKLRQAASALAAAVVSGDAAAGTHRPISVGRPYGGEGPGRFRHRLTTPAEEPYWLQPNQSYGPDPIGCSLKPAGLD